MWFNQDVKPNRKFSIWDVDMLPKVTISGINRIGGRFTNGSMAGKQVEI